MSSDEKIKEVTDQLAEIKKSIQDKYDKNMSRVEELQEKLKDIDNSPNQSKQWIDAQKKRTQTKIDELTKTINEWLDTQLEKAQAWADGTQEEIRKDGNNLPLTPAMALTGI